MNFFDPSEYECINDALETIESKNTNIHQLTDALFYAAKHNNLYAINILLDNGADPESGLEGACHEGYYTLINFFINKYGAKNWQRCLNTASSRGNLKLVQKFLKEHPELNVYEACSIASTNGHDHVMDYFESLVPAIKMKCNLNNMAALAMLLHR